MGTNLKSLILAVVIAATEDIFYDTSNDAPGEVSEATKALKTFGDALDELRHVTVNGGDTVPVLVHRNTEGELAELLAYLSGGAPDGSPEQYADWESFAEADEIRAAGGLIPWLVSQLYLHVIVNKRVPVPQWDDEEGSVTPASG